MVCREAKLAKRRIIAEVAGSSPVTATMSKRGRFSIVITSSIPARREGSQVFIFESFYKQLNTYDYERND